MSLSSQPPTSAPRAASPAPFKCVTVLVWRPAGTCQPYEGRRGVECICARVPIVTGLCHVPVSTDGAHFTASTHLAQVTNPLPKVLHILLCGFIMF